MCESVLLPWETGLVVLDVAKLFSSKETGPFILDTTFHARRGVPRPLPVQFIVYHHLIRITRVSADPTRRRTGGRGRSDAPMDVKPLMVAAGVGCGDVASGLPSVRWLR
jgi:hypothetical protein